MVSNTHMRRLTTSLPSPSGPTGHLHLPTHIYKSLTLKQMALEQTLWQWQWPRTDAPVKLRVPCVSHRCFSLVLAEYPTASLIKHGHLLPTVLEAEQYKTKATTFALMRISCWDSTQGKTEEPWSQGHTGNPLEKHVTHPLKRNLRGLISS